MPITLTETENPDFGPNNQANATIILTVPAGYEFNPAQVPSINADNGDLTGLAVAITATKITITYSTDAAAGSKDTIIVGAGPAIAVRPTVGTPLANSQIYRRTADPGTAPNLRWRAS